MRNKDKLESVIKQSGYRKSWIAEQIGMTPASLYNKMEGKCRWSYDEVIAICKLLKIGKKLREDIFFTQEANVIC